MSLAVILSRAATGMQTVPVSIEVHLSNGLPRFSIVGLPEAAVKESKERVRSALLSAEYAFPSKRITVNLAPADLPKQGGRFDLPIALGILAASKQIPSDSLAQYEFAGELALSGELRPIQGVLPFALAAREAGHQLVIPRENSDQAGIVKGLRLLVLDHLSDICLHLTGQKALSERAAPGLLAPVSLETEHDIGHIQGQAQAKRALEIAAAGAHNVLFSGPPGTGKTLLANVLPGILPILTAEESLEVATIASLGKTPFNLKAWGMPPFRAPHHTASAAALVGGGQPPCPGEISLSHHGVLFLDELPEFSRHVLDSLRQPLETGVVHISRAANHAQFPARFQLIGAMNPCPCGYYGDPQGNCRCTEQQVERYRGRLSGPLLDRIDLHIQVPRQAVQLFDTSVSVDTSATVRERVVTARQAQRTRQGRLNAHMSSRALLDNSGLTAEDRDFFSTACSQLQLSLRSAHRVFAVARTIADLAHSEVVERAHLSESLAYRRGF